MTDLPLDITQGPPDTLMPREPDAALEALAAACDVPKAERKAAVAAVVASWPRFLGGWAELGRLAEDDVEAYAYYRIGYHRGLDKLRSSGWRGSGYVRWEHEENRGFLSALNGLRRAAATLGEQDEVDRIGQFLIQLDPDTDLG